MSTNKHAIIRYQTLDRCFRNPGRRYYIDDLIDACNDAIFEYSGNAEGVKRRQVLEDIRFMESEQGWSIPLEHIRDGKRVYFRYEDMSFSINNQPLNEMEENQLKEAILTLSRFKGMPQFEWVNELATRLDAELGLSSSQEKVIEFEQNDFLQGLEHISPLYNAIVYKRTLNITYKSFKQENDQRLTFHPYYLKQYKNRWFVFGFSEEQNFIANLALDRIVEINESKSVFVPNNLVDFKEYFDDIIGVTYYKEAQLETILLKINNEVYPYVKTKPLHGSQTVKEKNDISTILQLKLIPNYELESLLLSYGDGIEVIAPESLRQRLMDKIIAMLSLYKK